MLYKGLYTLGATRINNTEKRIKRTTNIHVTQHDPSM